jgi:tRNA A-37 threonylcarbamoyl transferase component Bud32
MQAVTGPERVVAGRYRLVDQIGQGAMGTVWRATDMVLTREVAVKQVRLPGLMTTQERDILRERTLREARVSAKLNHPGVVTVHDVIEADGSPWIVMELVAARSLEQVLAEDGPLPPHQVAETGVMLLGALASAHAAGIVHRDVKPANVLVTCDGRAVLTDFGIATLDGDPGLTQAGMVMGTPGFCAPERIRGQPASPASDLWSLGATLYAAVEGHGPFDGLGSPMAVLASIVHSEPPPVRSAGPLGTVIGALLAKDPAQRPDAACAARLLADATTTAGIPTSGIAQAGAADPELAEATASTWPNGFPGGTGPPTPPGAGTAAFPGHVPPPVCLPSPAVPQPPGTAAPAQLGAAISFPPNPAVSLPPGPAMSFPLPAAAAFPSAPAADNGWPSLADEPGGTVHMPRPAGRSGHRGPADASWWRRHRMPALVIGGIAIVCTGLVAGVIVSLARGTASPAPGPSGTGQNGAGASAGTTRLPSGYRWYSQPAAAGTASGFSMAVPDGWHAHQRGTATSLADPASGGTITVTPGPPGTPGPLREVRVLEHSSVSLGSYPGYHRLGINPFFFHGALAVAWRFSYRQPGTGTTEALDVIAQLASPAGRRPFELMVTAPAAQWQSARNVFVEALRTIGPHP